MRVRFSTDLRLPSQAFHSWNPPTYKRTTAFGVWARPAKLTLPLSALTCHHASRRSQWPLDVFKIGIGRRCETRISEHPTPRPLPWLKPHKTGELRRKARKECRIQNWQKVIRFLACCRYFGSAESATISSLKLLGLSAAPASDVGYRHARATWSFLQLGPATREVSWVHDRSGGSATTPGQLDTATTSDSFWAYCGFGFG